MAFIKEKFDEHTAGRTDKRPLLWGLVTLGIWDKTFLI